MHLKSLTMKGFKSFAKQTTFEFEPGITCVVGPNGSGKSNVVDALAWVMGEQGAKILRGGSMEDVIFAGTASKAPLGRAEVELTIDNSDGKLPIEFAEVTISRTLFRNGGSEYAINREPCRLLDVQELLSDSGLGREMHVVVGQGQLDQILHANPEDRRRFIEEAAGILKHRRRKEKTIRKLDSMQTNLNRLNDLAGEIRRQLKPLGRQAEIAKEAQEIQAIVRDAKARILAEDVMNLSSELEDFHLTEKERIAERATLQDQIEGIRRRMAVLESGGGEENLDSIRAVDFQLRQWNERFLALETIAKERLQFSSAVKVDANTQKKVTPIQLSEKEIELKSTLSEIENQEKLFDQVTSDLSQARAVLEAAVSERDSVVLATEQWDATSRDAKALVELRKSRFESTLEEVKRQTDALENAKSRLEEIDKSLLDLESSDKNAESYRAKDFEKAVNDAESALKEAESLAVQKRDYFHKIEREKEALAAKVAALELALREDTGTSGSPQTKDLPGRVSDVLAVESGYETAIARALGSLTDAYLVESREQAFEIASSKLDHEGLIELVISEGASVDPQEFGGLVSAVDVVDGPAGIRALLLNTFIADDTPSVKAVWPKLPEGATVVTLDGNLFGHRVIRTGIGASQTRLELAAERDRATAELESLANSWELAQLEARQAEDQRSNAAEQVKAAIADLRKSDAFRAEFAEQNSSLRALADAAKEEVTRLGLYLETSKESLSEARGLLSESQDRLKSVQESSRPIVNESLVLQARKELDLYSAQEVEVRISLETVRQRAVTLSEQIESLVAQAEEDERIRAEGQAMSKQLVTRAERANSVLNILPAVFELTTASLKTSNESLISAEAQKQASVSELADLRDKDESARAKLLGITESVHSIEMQVYEKKLQRSNLLDRALEELGLDAESLLKEYGPSRVDSTESYDESDGNHQSRSEQEARLLEAESKLDQLGRVNPLALEEFEALENRHKYLVEQLADLKKTRSDLESIMSELDDTMQKIFSEAFRDTEEAFREVFPKLFPGGSGALRLTDPQDMLSTGVEVAVRPAGKKIERLSLLSGGERSLAAVALLISIFRARPSPFYILDEVEAALDDSNLGRLLEVISSLRDGSQLIIVTHQKRTMEIADALYGVSMRSDGVTSIVGQRVTESAALAS